MAPVDIDIMDIDDILNDESLGLDDLDSFLSGQISLDALHDSDHHAGGGTRTRADMKKAKEEQKRKRKEEKRKRKEEKRKRKEQNRTNGAGEAEGGFLKSLEDRFHYAQGITNIRKQRRKVRMTAATEAEVHL